MELRFATSVSTFSSFEALESCLLKHGRPGAFYSDKHTVFRIAKPSKHMTGMTQLGRALNRMKVEILCANSSQPYGPIERTNRTLHVRLDDARCWRDTRYVGKQLTFSYDRKRIMLDESVC